MRKILMVLLALSCVMLLSACQPQTQDEVLEVFEDVPEPGEAMEGEAMEEKNGEAMMEDKSGEAMEGEAMEEKDGEAMADETGDSAVKEFSMTARQFEFEPDTITVNEGDTVTLKITSIDVAHGFRLSEFGVSEILEPNDEVEVTFVADKAGEYTFACNKFCGSGHSGMKGTLIVN